MSVGYLRKREQCKVMERMLEAERAKVAQLREAARCHTCGKQATCVGVYEGREPAEFGCDDCCGHGNEDGWREHFADDAALAETAPDAPPVASELDAAHARIAELTEALRTARKVVAAPHPSALYTLGVLTQVDAALASTTPRGIGPEAVAKVREALMEARDFCRNGGSSANSREVLARWVFTRLDAAIALLPESR